MLRSQFRNAVEADVHAPRDDGAAMASALRRLAALRATLHRDWSDGPASLILFANEDGAASHGDTPAPARAWDAATFEFTLDPAFQPEPPAETAPGLRGRFDCLDEMPPPAPVPEEEEAAPEMHVGAGAPIGWLLDLVHAPADAPAPPAATLAATEAEEAPLFAVGAMADVLAWLDAPTATATPLAPPAPTAAPDDGEEILCAGAVAGCLALDAPVLPAAARAVEAAPLPTDDDENANAIGAFADIARLLVLAPPPATFVAPPVIDLDLVALDNALADACEALYAAAFDPTEHYAWGASTLPEGEATAAALAACETALWNLPRIASCAEVFALNPNHETAVKITRALRVRADTLQARAFTDNAVFGLLRANEAFLPWFPSVETPDEPAADTLDADTALSTWGLEETTPRITAPDRPRPILSEAELDALLATPAAHDSHELDDGWQENPVWRDTFWHGVDSYLQSVEDCEFRKEAIRAEPEANTHPDLEFRDEVAVTSATHFWRPGDEDDLAIDGEGFDLFLIGGDQTGVVLVEDGAMHAMRTGRGTRVGEVVVSWSDNRWADVDDTDWTRVATLSGVSDLRVEQSGAHDRAVIICGELSGAALKADRVRLVEMTEDGPLDFPVRQVGGFGDGMSSAWPFADSAEPVGDTCLLI